MKRVVMLLAVLLSTSVAMNANTITRKSTTSKEVKTTVVRKHKKHRKAAAKTATVATPATPAKK